MNLQALIKAVRELSYDRFPVPVLGIKGTEVQSSTIEFLGGIFTSANPAWTINVASFPTLDDVLTEFYNKGEVMAILPGYRASSSSSYLLPMRNSARSLDKFVFQKSFFSDGDITDIIIRYFKIVHSLDITVGTLPAKLVEIDADASTSERVYYHMQLYCALWMLDYRRLFEYSASMYQLIYSDGSAGVPGSTVPPFGSMLAQNTDGDRISVQIGSVFNIEDNDTDSGNSVKSTYTGSSSSGAAGLAGTELFFNDENSYWYRYYCWLRDKLEQRFQDFYFRKENGVWGTTTVTKELSIRTYFDSYPFFDNPYPRGIH